MLPPTSSESCRASASAPAAADATSPGDDDSSPLGEPEFADLMRRFCPVPSGAVLAVAVSGGGDSMALALLAERWARASGREIRAVSVDHRLRAGSGAEADWVGRQLAARGIAHDVLAWDDPKPAAGLQTAARAARYRLISDWAARRGIRHLLLGHQREDQAETLLMRLARGSGVAGLAAMRAVSERGGLRLLRPLLSVPRARLRATLRAAEQDWIEDPSNEAPRFARTGYRRLAAALAAHGVDADRLCGMAEDFARLDALLEAAARRFLGAAALWDADGTVTIDRRLFRAAPPAVALAALRYVLAEIARRPHAPRSERLARAHGRLVSAEGRAAFTLGYCRFAATEGAIRIAREPGRRRAREFSSLPK